MVIALLRTILLYLFLIAGVRLMGKRQVGELEPSELVLAMLLSDLAAVPMQDFGIPLLSGLIPIVTLLCITMILSVLTMRSVRFRAVACGRPTVVIHNGVIQQSAMDQARMTLDELSEELRLQGVSDFNTVKYAILETSGQLSVLLYQSAQPPAAGDLGTPVSEPGLPVPLISDGRLLKDNLTRRGLDEQWLEAELRRRGIASYRQVFLMTIDEEEQIYFAQKESSS